MAQAPNFDRLTQQSDLDVVVATYLANLGRSCLSGGGVFELAAVVLVAAGAIVGLWLRRLDYLWVFAVTLGLWLVYDLSRLHDCMDSVRVSYSVVSDHPHYGVVGVAPAYGAALSPWGWIAAGCGLTMLTWVSLADRIAAPR